MTKNQNCTLRSLHTILRTRSGHYGQVRAKIITHLNFKIEHTMSVSLSCTQHIHTRPIALLINDGHFHSISFDEDRTQVMERNEEKSSDRNNKKIDSLLDRLYSEYMTCEPTKSPFTHCLLFGTWRVLLAVCACCGLTAHKVPLFFVNFIFGSKIGRFTCWTYDSNNNDDMARAINDTLQTNGQTQTVRSRVSETEKFFNTLGRYQYHRHRTHTNTHTDTHAVAMTARATHNRTPERDNRNVPWRVFTACYEEKRKRMKWKEIKTHA